MGTGTILIIVGTIIVVYISFQMLFSTSSESDKLAELSVTGIYYCRGKQILPLDTLPDDGSINSICRMMKYGVHECHTLVSATHHLKKTEYIVFEKKSLQPIFFSMKDKNYRPSYNMMVRELQGIDWKWEKKTYNL